MKYIPQNISQEAEIGGLRPERVKRMKHPTMGELLSKPSSSRRFDFGLSDTDGWSGITPKEHGHPTILGMVIREFLGLVER